MGNGAPMTEREEGKPPRDLHAVTYMVNLVQTLIGRLDFASDRNFSALAWQDQISRRMTVLWWAYFGLFVVQTLGDWFAPGCRCW